jgi:sulfide:quinone oxidoreductase
MEPALRRGRLSATTEVCVTKGNGTATKRNATVPCRIAIAGGGVAALEATLALRALAEERVSIELIAPAPDFVYQPLAVAEPVRVGEVRRFPLPALAEAAGAHFRQGEVTSVDWGRHAVELRDGSEIRYDILLVALGARPQTGVPNGLTFRGPEDGPAFAEILEEAVMGETQSIAFALPAGISWPLPLYELALLTDAFLTDRGTRGVKIILVTPEEKPLALFGDRASNAIKELLELRGIEVRLRTVPLHFEDGTLRVAPEAEIQADRVVALPKLQGPWMAGLPVDGEGFIPADRFGRVASVEDVYVAGDATRFPLKQGGIAAQQADAAATSIAAEVGAPVEPVPFRPILRGLLLTGMTPHFLRADVGTARSDVDLEPLWWPPAKIVGRYLAPFLASRLGLSQAPPEAPAGGAVPVEIELEFSPRELAAWMQI